MSLSVIGLIMIAALMHATWNALVKLGEDRLMAMTLVSGFSGMIGLCLTPFFPLPLAAAWPFIAATSLLHIGYIWFLTKAYEHGDFGQVYPIARGVAPLLTATGAMIFGGEVLSISGFAGVALIGGGIMSLAFSGGTVRDDRSRESVRYALLTGCFIASYTLVDGFGARASGNVGSYLAWLFALHGLPLVFVVAWIRRGSLLSAAARSWRVGLAGSVLSIGAYWIVLWAFTLGAIGPVAALRETSVVFGAVFAAVHLKEHFGLWRVVSAGLVACGIVLIAL